MVRTKDLILYLLVLFFVLLGATYTGLTSRVHDSLYSYISPDFTTTEEQEYDVFVSDSKLDRKGRIEELRSKIALGKDTRSGEISVSIPLETVKSSEVNDAETFSGTRAVKYCNVAAPPKLGGIWPNVTTLAEVEGLRVVSTLITKDPIGSSTESINETIEILTLPVRQIGSGYTTCLPDTLIGVSKSGQPLYNSSATQYTTYSHSSLVGYSRDGFPIKGITSEPDKLDECGGEFENGQYSYYIRSGEDFIIGCYVGIPTPINIPSL